MASALRDRQAHIAPRRRVTFPPSPFRRPGRPTGCRQLLRPLCPGSGAARRQRSERGSRWPGGRPRPRRGSREVREQGPPASGRCGPGRGPGPGGIGVGDPSGPQGQVSGFGGVGCDGAAGVGSNPVPRPGGVQPCVFRAGSPCTGRPPGCSPVRAERRHKRARAASARSPGQGLDPARPGTRLTALSPLLG